MHEQKAVGCGCKGMAHDPDCFTQNPVKGVETTMVHSDKPDVIAQSYDRRVLADGTLEHNNYPANSWREMNSLMYEERRSAALLADAVRRVEEDFEGRLEEIVTAAYGCIEAMEAEIETFQEEQAKIDAAQDDRLAAVEAMQKGKALDFEAAARMVRRDIDAANLADQKYQDIVDRVSALEATPDTGLDAVEARLTALEDRQQNLGETVSEMGLVSSRVERQLSDRVAALERWMRVVEDSDEEDPIEELSDRVSSLEQALGGVRKVRDRALITETKDPLETRHQDEAGEGSEASEDFDHVFDLEARMIKSMWCFTEAGLKEHDNHTRRKTAREIVGGLRCGNAHRDFVRASLSDQDICADWIENEFGGDKDTDNETDSPEVETGDGWAVHKCIADAIRRELARKIVDWLRQRYAYGGPSEKGKHASGVIMGAAAQIERDHCK